VVEAGAGGWEGNRGTEPRLGATHAITRDPRDPHAATAHRPAQDWIFDKLVDREKARVRRDFGAADAIREELFKAGVEIWESHGERTWRARDGRSGPRPNHEGKVI
tara:strand:+ start:118 stop:435 length:318 start_codon:yes stop_codon:yes gene_type:complete